MRALKIASLTVLLIIFSVGHVQADEVAALVDRTVSMTQNLIQKIRKEIFAQTILDQKPEYLELEQSIEAIVDRKIRPAATASIKNGKRYIDFSVGTVLSVIYYTDYATIRMLFDDKASADCRNYMKYFGEEIKRSADRTIEDFYKKVMSPSKFCGVEVRFDEKPVKDIREKLFIETLIPVVALMLGHEIGHHLLGHLPPKNVSPARAREIEAEADRFGSVLASTSIVRAPASVIFTILAAARRGHPFEPDRRHDTAECRFLFYLKDDQRILGEDIGGYILESLRKRKDITEQIPEIRNVIGGVTTGQSFASKCSILQ